LGGPRLPPFDRHFAVFLPQQEGVFGISSGQDFHLRLPALAETVESSDYHAVIEAAPGFQFDNLA
jgi:hypothetical protein